MLSDFLTRLIERSSGTAAAVRPVIPPLFGPGPASESPDETTAHALAAGVPAGPLNRGEVVPRPADAAVSERPTTERLTPAPSGQPLEHHRITDAPDEPAPIRIVTAFEPGPAANASKPPTTNSQDGSEPPVDAPAPASRLVPDMPEHGRWRDLGARGERRGEGPPTVIVNIGRVEVRAITPAPPPAPPQRRVKAAVSLEEYLRPGRRER